MDRRMDGRSLNLSEPPLPLFPVLPLSPLSLARLLLLCCVPVLCFPPGFPVTSIPSPHLCILSLCGPHAFALSLRPGSPVASPLLLPMWSSFPSPIAFVLMKFLLT